MARDSFAGYAPLYEQIILAAADDPDLLARVLDTPAGAHWSLPLLAAAHDLVLTEPGLELAAVYRGASDADPAPLFLELVHDRWDEIAERMLTRHIQTNECGRTAVLGPVLTWLVAGVDHPVARLDVGTSAGLTLLADRYRLDYGTFGATGPADSPVVIPCEVTEGLPPIAAELPDLAANVGIDRDPIDLANDNDRRWLVACTWPGTGRTERTAAALDLAQRHRPDVRQGDAVTDLGAAIATLPADAAVIITTSWVVGYFDSLTRAAFGQALVEVAQDRPIAWVAMEGAGVADEVAQAAAAEAPHAADRSWDVSVMTVTYLQKTRAEHRQLGDVHHHGQSMAWRAPDALDEVWTTA